MKSFIAYVCVIVLFVSCSDMSEKRRIKNLSRLKNVKKIALANFAVNETYTVGSGENIKKEKNLEKVKAFGKLHLSNLYRLIEVRESPSFLNLNDMILMPDYQEMKFDCFYIRKNKVLPSWLFGEHKFISPLDGLGAVKLNSDNARKICKTLNVDAVLSVEASYNLTAGASVPFVSPNWCANCEIKSGLFDSTGEKIWVYNFKEKSLLELKAEESTNIIIYSSSSISGEQIYELMQSVTKYTSLKLIGALYSDIVTAI